MSERTKLRVEVNRPVRLLLGSVVLGASVALGAIGTVHGVNYLGEDSTVKIVDADSPVDFIVDSSAANQRESDDKSDATTELTVAGCLAILDSCILLGAVSLTRRPEDAQPPITE